MFEFVYATLFVCYASYAYCRKCVSFAMPKIIDEGLDKSHAGLIASSQNAAFALSKFLAGILSDTLNPQTLFAIGLLVCGVSTLLFAASSSVETFVVLWFVNGLAQGCGWPSCAKILRERAHPSQFGTLWSILSSSNNVSGGLSPFLAAYFIENAGWRRSLIVPGLLSVVLAFVFALNASLSAKPSSFEKHGSEDVEERKKKAADLKEVSKSKSIRLLLSDPFMWLVSFGYMVVMCARTTTVDWGQLYLVEDMKFSHFVASAFTSSVESGGFLGRICAGYLTDFVVARNSRRKMPNKTSNPRMRVAVLFLLCSLICLHSFVFGLTQSSSTVSIAMLGFLMGFGFYGPIAVFGIVSSESAPPRLSGTANAIAALAGNVGAVLSGLPFSFIAKHFSWSTVFLIVELITGFAVMVMIYFKNLKSIYATELKDDK